MAILDKQLSKLNERLLLEALQKGRVPPSREIALKLARFLQQADGGPLMRPRFQAFGQRWDHLATNAVFKDILFDLEVAFEELVDQLSTQIARASFVELSHLSQSRELDRIQALLESLLLVSQNAEGNFFGVYDSFDDVTKVNLVASTQDVVDLEEGVACLPANDPTAARLDMAHLYNTEAWPIQVTAPESVDGETPTQIVQNEPGPQSGFGLAFSDMVNAWRQVVTTNNDRGATITFTVPLSGTTGQEYTISRILLTSASSQTMKVRVLHSNDNVNYIRFPNVPEEVDVAAGESRSWNFEDTRTEFVRFIVTLTRPTVVDQGSYSYVFGFRGIAFYKMGRVQQAVLVSKPLTPTGKTTPIDKVALSVVEDIPANCAIDHFVAADDGSGAPRNGVWLPIQPIERGLKEGVPAYLRFGESGFQSVHLPAPSTSRLFSTVRNVDYYEITTEPLTYEPLFRQTRLYRGENGWYRNTQREKVLKTMRDCYIDFTPGDLQNLWAIRTEEPDVTTYAPPGVRLPYGMTGVTVLTVDRPIDYNDARMTMIPPIAQIKQTVGDATGGSNTNEPESDEAPQWAIYRVERIRDTMKIYDEETTLNGTAWTAIGKTSTFLGHFGVSGVDRPIVTNSAGTIVYTEGVHYHLETVFDGVSEYLTGRIQRIATATSPIGDGDTVKVTFTLLSDITYMVQTISGNRIQLQYDLGSVDDQYFRVTYRFVPKAPLDTIRKSTIKVTSRFGDTADEERYDEGSDYIVSAEQGTIKRMTGQGSGLNTQDTVYVDFVYEEEPPDLDVFTSWVFVDRKVPLLIRINPLELDIDYGERVSIDGVDVTTRTDLPELPYGWHQIIVRSRRPEAHTNAAIKQLALLKDREGNAVFVAGGAFFARMVARYEPLLQKTYTQLTKATPPTDHGYFAITSSKRVILNFEPGTAEEIYTYGYRLVDGTLTAGTWGEEFLLEYSHALTASEPVTALLYRALLRRSGESNTAALTPRLHSYHLRIG